MDRPAAPVSLAEPAALPLSADAAGSQPKQRAGRTGRLPAFTDEQAASLRAEYEAAGKPYGWITKKADQLGVGTSTLHRAVSEPAPKREPVPDYVGGERREAAKGVEATKPDTKPVVSTKQTNGHTQPPDEQPELPHTETPQCWCRKKRASRDNVWCKLRAWQKPASEHAALRTPEPRAERFKVRRVQGTYGGG